MADSIRIFKPAEYIRYSAFQKPLEGTLQPVGVCNHPEFNFICAYCDHQGVDSPYKTRKEKEFKLICE
jgi:hypothetical protein